MKVNLGCGRRSLPGWVNVDRMLLPGVDVVADLDDPDKVVLPWPDDSIDEFVLSHVLEHIRYPLPLMAEVWRVAKPGATIDIACPYGSSDDADEDPTHVRRIFLHTFDYFGQPYYWRADYGYRADWRVERLTLDVGAAYAGVPGADIMRDVMHLRNVVEQIMARLVAVKPAREPKRDLITAPDVAFRVRG